MVRRRGRRGGAGEKGTTGKQGAKEGRSVLGQEERGASAGTMAVKLPGLCRKKRRERMGTNRNTTIIELVLVALKNI